MRDRSRDSKILQKLAEQLPEELLRKLFPAIDPDLIRESLRHASGSSHSSGSDETIPKTVPQEGGPERSPFLKEQAKSCMLYTDGASRGNPGEAGAGIVLLDDCRQELAVRSMYLGQCTNNSAEYLALIAGLELATEYGCSELHVFLDSELIVRQLNGQYRVKNEQLKPLFTKAMALLDRLKQWRIDHVPRSENTRADELANRGIDERQ